MTFLLKRLEDRGYFPLQRNSTYVCGRSKKNDIVCPSPLVSRIHCCFYCSDSELYIATLGSLTFINGIAQKTLQHIKLSENDIIGIGCPNMDPNNDSFYNYKVCVIKSPEEVLKEEGETSTLSRAVSNNNSLQKITALPTKRVMGEKYRYRPDSFCEMIRPIKIRKIVDSNGHSSRTSAEAKMIKMDGPTLHTSSSSNAEDLEILKAQINSLRAELAKKKKDEAKKKELKRRIWLRRRNTNY